MAEINITMSPEELGRQFAEMSDDQQVRFFEGAADGFERPHIAEMQGLYVRDASSEKSKEFIQSFFIWHFSLYCLMRDGDPDE